MLSIAGTRSSEHSETDEVGRFSRLERRFGAFQRRFKLPQNVDTGAISAKVGRDHHHRLLVWCSLPRTPPRWLSLCRRQLRHFTGCLLHMQLSLPLQLCAAVSAIAAQSAAATAPAATCCRTLPPHDRSHHLRSPCADKRPCAGCPQVNNGELEVRIPKTAAAPKQQEIKVE
jgi:Hsp20/alpha crystallin family